MTGRAVPVRRSPSVRRVICGRCEKSFLPKRTDAEFCSNSCKQADYRARKLKEEANRAFKTELQIAQNAHDIDLHHEWYQDRAIRLNSEAWQHGIKRVKFLGTLLGLFAVDEAPGAVRLAMARDDWRGGSELRGMDMTERRTGDPEVIEALLRKTSGWTSRRREHEMECRNTLKERQVFLDRQVFLFTCRPYCPEPELPLMRLSAIDWHLQRDDDWARIGRRLFDDGQAADDDRSGGDLNVNNVFPGGGYSTFKV